MPYRRKKLTFAISSPDEFLSTKTDVAKHESVTEKHLKSASYKTQSHTVVYTVYAFFILNFFMDYSIQKIKLQHHNSNLNTRLQ